MIPPRRRILSAHPWVAASGVTQLARPAHRPWDFARGSSSRREQGCAAHKSRGHAALSGDAGDKDDEDDDEVAEDPFALDGDAASGGLDRVPDAGQEPLLGCVYVPNQPPDAYRVRTPVAHLSFPLELQLAYDPLLALERFGHVTDPSPPSLCLAVYAKDGWDRHTLLGVGSLRLPIAAGRHEARVACWAPAARDAPTAQADFFLGGARRVDDLSDAGIPLAVATEAARVRKAREVVTARAAESEEDAAAGERPAGAGGGDGEEATPLLRSTPDQRSSAPLAADAKDVLAALRQRLEEEVTLSRVGLRSTASGEVGVRCDVLLQRPRPSQAAAMARNNS
jgi:hypothetical protein